MIQISKPNTDKYLSFLNDVHSALKEGKHLSMNDAVAAHGVHYHTSPVMKKFGLITGNGKKGLAAKWEWSTVAPNENMATELIRKLNQYQPDKKPTEPRVKLKPEAVAARRQLISSEEAIDLAIQLLKNNGYKILKPTFTEV